MPRKSEVEEYTDLRHLADDILLCKALWSHAWDSNPSPQNIDSHLARAAYAVMALRCLRCGRERYDYLLRSGERFGRYYKNPIGYPKTHRHAGEAIMQELIRRKLAVGRYK